MISASDKVDCDRGALSSSRMVDCCWWWWLLFDRNGVLSLSRGVSKTGGAEIFLSEGERTEAEVAVADDTVVSTDSSMLEMLGSGVSFIGCKKVNKRISFVFTLCKRSNLQKDATITKQRVAKNSTIRAAIQISLRVQKIRHTVTDKL